MVRPPLGGRRHSLGALSLLLIFRIGFHAAGERSGGRIVQSGFLRRIGLHKEGKNGIFDATGVRPVMGKTVTTYLIDGDPKGTQYVFISNKICQMFVIPRSNLTYLNEQEKLTSRLFTS